MLDNITIIAALQIVCERWPVGQVKTGLQIYREVQDVLKSHGYKDEPMDSTVTRRLREMDAGYGVHALKTGVSEYVKEDKLEYRSKVIHGQAGAQA